MVTYNQVRTKSAISVIRPVEGICLVREQSKLGYFYPQWTILLHACATCYELPSNISTMDLSTKIVIHLKVNIYIIAGNSILSFKQKSSRFYSVPSALDWTIQYPWYLDDNLYSGTHETVIRPVEGIWLVREQSQIGYFYPKWPILLHACATCYELQSKKSNMDVTTTFCRVQLYYISRWISI